MKNSSEVSAIGLGSMGGAIAHALVARGNRVTVWNRSPEKMTAFTQAGARGAESATEAVAASSLIVMCVSDFAAARSVLETPATTAALKGKTLVQMTIGVAEDVTRQQKWAHEKGIKFIAGLVVAYPRSVGQPNCLVVYGGDPITKEHADILASLGESQFLGSDPVSVIKSSYALGPMIIGTLALFFETAAVARQSGLTINQHYALTRLIFDEILNGMRDGVYRIGTRDFRGDQATIDVTIAAMHDFCKSMEAAGVPAIISRAVIDLLQISKDAGNSDKDIATLVDSLIGHKALAAKR
jgi:3-hydroxyisobutyrate dehydrogenase-like beta-hydroxyacid dehydrogenase